MSAEDSDHAAGQDEQALFRRANEDLAARDALAERYRYLGDYLARRFAGRGEPVEDLQQVAAIGLLKAIRGFDPSREVQFTTYASATIVGELKRHFRDKGWAVRVPRRLQELGLEVSKVSSDMTRELGRTPTIPELAARTGLPGDEVVEALDAMRAYSAAPIDAPAGEEGNAPIDTLGADDPSLEIAERWAGIAPEIKKLPARERQILYLRFFEDKTQSEIAEVMGISQMHVSRLLTKSLDALRGGGRGG